MIKSFIYICILMNREMIKRIRSMVKAWMFETGFDQQFLQHQTRTIPFTNFIKSNTWVHPFHKLTCSSFPTIPWAHLQSLPYHIPLPTIRLFLLSARILLYLHSLLICSQSSQYQCLHICLKYNAVFLPDYPHHFHWEWSDFSCTGHSSKMRWSYQTEISMK